MLSFERESIILINLIVNIIIKKAFVIFNNVQHKLIEGASKTISFKRIIRVTAPEKRATNISVEKYSLLQLYHTSPSWNEWRKFRLIWCSITAAINFSPLQKEKIYIFL